jgi:ABC-type transporter MlaC component
MLIYHGIVKRWQRATVAGLMSLMVFSVVGACASDAPKAPPPPSADQVRSHADRAFEKLKQEEQERAAQPPVPR